MEETDLELTCFLRAAYERRTGHEERAMLTTMYANICAEFARSENDISAAVDARLLNL
jgi:hypothetical protein